ncbi:MAG: amidohydrolase family protein [Candidatus Thorarchaeota archaeon]
MLVVRAIEDIPEQSIKKDDLFHLYLVDAHHHMGREKSHRNTPGGAYDFYQLLWFEMKRIAEKAIGNDELLFEPIQIIPTPFVSNLFSSRDSWERMKHGWLVDRTIVFPYSDDYAKQGPEGSPSFKISNDKIAGWTTRAPHSSRLIGFARVDPMDGRNGDANLAVRELDRAILDLGLRGLKLHPLAQLFIDELEDDLVRRVVYRAAQLRIPVLFDTRNIRTVTRIRHLVKIMREEPQYSQAIGNLRIILAHAGMSPGSPKLYDILNDPIFSADTSTLHGQDIPLLFEMASERIQSTKRWSESLLFATDYSFLSVQAAELIIASLSRAFPGDLSDVQRILGGNTLSLVQKPYNSSLESKRSSKQLACPNNNGSSRKALEDALIKTMHEKEWDLSSLDLMIPPRHTWPRIRTVQEGGYNGVHLDSYILTMKNKEANYEIHLWVRENPGDILTIASVRTSGENALRTTNYATHRVGESVIEELSKNTRYEKDLEALLDNVPKLFG